MENTIEINNKNKSIVSVLEAYRDKLFQEARPYADDVSLADNVEKIDEDNYIKKEDKEKYGALMTFLTYLDYSPSTPEPSENVYEFRGLEYKKDDQHKKGTFYLKKDHALALSKKASDIENHLSEIGIKLPAELHLLKYKGTNMPGLDYEAPEPKTANIDITEHEQNLESYYQSHGVSKEVDGTADFRKAYPHEKIDYTKEPAEITEEVTHNGYYSDAVEEIASLDLGGDESEPGLRPGERQPITGTDLPLGRRIGESLLNIKNFLTSGTLKTKFLKGLAVAGFGYLAVNAFIASPIITSMLAATAGLTVLGIKYVVPSVQKNYRAFKNKINEWLFGPQLTQQQGQPEQPETPTMTTEQIQTRLIEINNRITELTDDAEALQTRKGELIADNPDDPEIAQLESQIQAKRAEIETLRDEVANLLHQNDLENSNGGPRR